MFFFLTDLQNPSKKIKSFSALCFPVFELIMEIYSHVSVPNPNGRKYGTEKLQIWTFFAQSVNKINFASKNKSIHKVSIGEQTLNSLLHLK